MSFEAYLENIKAKTGKTPEDFMQLAEKLGFIENGEVKPTVKAGEIVAWLKNDFNLGHGHAMAIYSVFKGLKEQLQDTEGTLGKHFTGEKEKWRTVYDALIKKINAFGNDISIAPVASYISLLSGDRKFAIVQITKDRMDIGIKLKNQAPTDRFENAGNWNAIMTHKVSIITSKELDKELYSWLQKAYEQNVPKNE
ncbi:DUF4287 domain-containing protein [Solitalea sp. MAHUQ-68]|uniref:DUF4287 domain-containing protein n=1 Tax=Solitalea agri TaxID=2953739 RepID=A0A9X2JD27_9SPHI|nr:DUF4287 domain-containing protein [Solitalea agri]MCO4294097.1 DUF4287 domain-containing protein [Solitalea agri]